MLITHSQYIVFLLRLHDVPRMSVSMLQIACVTLSLYHIVKDILIATKTPNYNEQSLVCSKTKTMFYDSELFHTYKITT